MKVNLAKIQTVFLVGISVLMVWFIAKNQIIEMNEYAGMRKLTPSLGLFFSCMYIFAMLVVFFKSQQNSPQGILIGILLFYSFIWFFAFYSVSGYLDSNLIFVGGLIFLFPMFILLLSEKYLKINFEKGVFENGFFNARIEVAITLILILVTILMYQKMEISFSFFDSYERRLLGREVVDRFLAYLLSMSLNGLAPLLAFLGIYNRKYMYLIFAYVFVCLGFGFIGTKTPIAFVILMSLMAIYYAKGRKNVVFLLVIAMTGLIFLALVEYFFFGFSWIADVYVRRAMLTVPQLQMYFLDFIFNDSLNSFNFLNGTLINKQVTFLIGEFYLGNPEANANTISFLTDFGRWGVLGYLFSIVFLVAFFSFMAHLYKCSKHEVWLAMSTLYALILLEQSYSVAFVSSGIGLSIVLLIVFNYKKTPY